MVPFLPTSPRWDFQPIGSDLVVRCQRREADPLSLILQNLVSLPPPPGSPPWCSLSSSHSGLNLSPVCPQISLCSSASPSWYSSSPMTTITSHYSVRSSGIRGKSSLTLYLQYLAQGLACSRCSINVVIWIKGREEEGKEERKGDGTLWELHFLFETRLIIICPSVHRWQLKSGFYFL